MKAIFTKYHPHTLAGGARYSARDLDDNRVFVPPADQYEDCHDAAALALCAKMGWTGDLICGGGPQGNVYVFADGRRVRNPVKEIKQ